MKLETIAVHSGGEPDETTGAIAPPIHLSSTYELSADSRLIHGYRYVREASPTQSRLETALAAIEGGAASLVFASGMAAGAAILQTLEPGSHVLIPDDAYYAYRLLARDFLAKWGIEAEIVAMDDLDALRRSIRPTTRIVWAESPSNPLMKVVDLEAIAAIAREAGAISLVDSTFATPMLQQPIALGADGVLHSSTKYFGGHSDVHGGVLVFRETGPLFDATLHARRIVGGVASPFNSWLVLRGIRTLGARMRVHCDNAEAVARFLEAHPAVARVHYPGLASHPAHAIAVRQMKRFGGMVSFETKGNRQRSVDVVGALRLFVRATSLGGVESLVEHRASTEGVGTTTPETLIRLSIGLEHPDDLIADLAEALEGK
jgi:cystathionine gamma-synthase